ncbi:MAG: hypothetical protein LLG37_06720, partial [Spirochaetia bacterium]|nr:hypothetical protein [Spirochaetia bacterium]
MKVNPQLFVRVSASFAVICAVMLWPGASQVYQLPKGAAFVAAMVVCMSALAFSRDGFDMDLASCVLTMFYLYTVSRLLFSTANPSFIYGLTYFS